MEGGISCHHNAGPIFSNPPWSETPASPIVSARLAQAKGTPAPEPHQIAAHRRSAEALHRSVGSANRLLHASRYWSRTCAAPNTARHCRVNLLSTVLEHRLSGRRSFGQGDYLTRRESEIFLEETQRFAWPNGFEIATPFIGDIDPTIRVDRQDHATADPLTSRPMLGALDVSQSNANNEIFELLGDFFTGADIRWLEKTLSNLAEGVGAPRRVIRVPCAFKPISSDGGESSGVFTCIGRVPGFPSMVGRLVPGGSGTSRVLIDRLSIELLEYRGLVAPVETPPSDRAGAGRVTARPIEPATGLQPRTGDGWIITSVNLPWPSPRQGAGEAIFTIIQDIKRFRTTIGTLAGYRLPGSSRAVTDGGLRRREFMRALAIRLGQPVPDWCCGPAPGLPPPTPPVEAARLTIAGLSTAPGPAHPSLQAFHRVCGACHAGRSAAPPNFLFGPSERQIQAIAGCAPRILARLEQWKSKVPRLPPMPPPAHLARSGVTPEAWIASADYRKILRFTSALGGQAFVPLMTDRKDPPACAPNLGRK